MSNFVPSRPQEVSLARRSFAIVASQYNPEFVSGLAEAAQRELLHLLPDASIQIYEAPGAFEIPVVVQEVAEGGGLEGIIALGIIIQGETAHAELIGRTVTDALQDIALRFRVPVIHEVLLVKNEDLARARTGSDEHNRGVEAARAAVRVAEILEKLRKR
jgi:6,7-dimethyl-8-ribityllumazine synthase